MPSSAEKAELMREIFTPNNVWASTAIGGVEEELTLTSGQTCLARKMTIQGVLESGMLAQVDSLTGVVDSYTRKVKGGKGVADGTPVISDDILKDPKALITIIGVVDNLLPHILISPKVLPHWTEQTVGSTKVTKMIPAKDRTPDQVYTDQIDLTDKMELFDWALGGLSAFSSFRDKADGDVGSVGAGEGPRRKAKRRNRDR